MKMKFLAANCLLWAAWLLAASVGGVPAGEFNWNTARFVSRDIKHAELTVHNPRPLKINVIRVDMNNPKIYLTATARDKDWGKPMPDYPKMNIQTKRTRVGDFMRQQLAAGHDIRVAVNASPWRPWTKPYTHKYACNTGLTISAGQIVALPDKRTVPALYVTKSGKLGMKSVKPGDNVDDLQTAVSGFQFVLQDGKQVCNDAKTLHPRTFYGLSKDCKILYLMVVDGRQKGYSEGMALNEGAAWLKYFGANDGINMDGGGSTTLVLRKNRKPKLINRPPGTKSINGTRLVATCLGVCYKD